VIQDDFMSNSQDDFMSNSQDDFMLCAMADRAATEQNLIS
jgi:hypothetical protein